MGRHKKTGLKYFPLDCDFFSDRKIRRLISRFGSDGALFYLYVLATAYKDSFFVEYTEDFKDDAALDIGCSVEKIDLMLHYLLDKTLLDSTLFNTVKVLSSHGIQSQYQDSMSGLKREIEVEKDFWILDESETQGFVKVRSSENKSGKNDIKSEIFNDKSGENALNKRKEKGKKNKENKSKVTPYIPPAGETGYGQKLQAAFEAWITYKAEKRQQYKPSGLKALVSEIKNNADKYGEDAVAELIYQCMASNWQGIIFDRLKNKPMQQNQEKRNGNVFAQMMEEERYG